MKIMKKSNTFYETSRMVLGPVADPEGGAHPGANPEGCLPLESIAGEPAARGNVLKIF